MRRKLLVAGLVGGAVLAFGAAAAMAASMHLTANRSTVGNGRLTLKVRGHADQSGSYVVFAQPLKLRCGRSTTYENQGGANGSKIGHVVAIRQNITEGEDFSDTFHIRLQQRRSYRLCGYLGDSNQNLDNPPDALGRLVICRNGTRRRGSTCVRRR